MNGSGFAVLHWFNGGNGAFPSYLIQSSNTIYRTTPGGHNVGSGTTFKLNDDGDELAFQETEPIGYNATCRWD